MTPSEYSAKSSRYDDVKWMRTLWLTSANNQDYYYYSNHNDTDRHGYSNHVFFGLTATVKNEQYFNAFSINKLCLFCVKIWLAYNCVYFRCNQWKLSSNLRGLRWNTGISSDRIRNKLVMTRIINMQQMFYYSVAILI